MTSEAEAEQVEKWRRDFFDRLGFEPRPALALTISGADPHDVERVLEAGCSHEVAVQIFL